MYFLTDTREIFTQTTPTYQINQLVFLHDMYMNYLKEVHYCYNNDV